MRTIIALFVAAALSAPAVVVACNHELQVCGWHAETYRCWWVCYPVGPPASATSGRRASAACDARARLSAEVQRPRAVSKAPTARVVALHRDQKR